MKRLLTLLIAAACIATPAAAIWLQQFIVTGQVTVAGGAQPAPITISCDLNIPNGDDFTQCTESVNLPDAKSFQFVLDDSGISSTNGSCTMSPADLSFLIQGNPISSTQHPTINFPVGNTDVQVKLNIHALACPCSGTFVITGTEV